MQRLFERDYPSLVRFLYRRLGDRDQAEDLAQEAFIRLLQRQPDNPRAYLFATALNLMRDVVRGEARRARHLQVLAGERTGAFAPSPEGEVVRNETATEVRSALGALSERDHTLLLLWEEGFAYKEIAEMLGVSPTSIGPLLARAQKRFLKHYEKQNDSIRRAAPG
ncbi:MAG TPA: sigma-70 family RNA polymerase sigma factor [Longimicrobiales bacterium]